MQAVIKPSLGNQFDMIALFDDLAVLQHDDTIRVAHGGQPVCDDDAGAPRQRTRQRGLDFALGETVDVRRRLVEHQNAGIRHDGAREAQQLALTDGNIHAALTEDRIVAVRQAFDEIMRADGLGGTDHLVARRVLAVIADIFQHGAGEQERFLQHHGDMTAERFLRHIAHVAPADQDLAVPHIVEAMQQRHGRGLARSGWPDQRHGFAGGDLEADVLQYRQACDIAEGHVAELDGAVDLAQIFGVRLIDHIDGHVEHFKNAMPRRHGALRDGVLLRQRTDRIEEALYIEQERDHHAEIERLIEHHVAADHDDDGHGQTGQGVDRRDHDIGDLGRADMGVKILPRLDLEIFEIDGLTAHLLHRAHAIDVFGQRRVDDRTGRARPRKRAPGDRLPERTHNNQDRQYGERQQTELGIERQQHDDDAEQQDDIADGVDRTFEEFLQRADIALQPAHQAADLRAVHEGERDFLQVPVHGRAQILQDMFRDPCDHDVLPIIRDVIDER